MLAKKFVLLTELGKLWIKKLNTLAIKYMKRFPCNRHIYKPLAVKRVTQDYNVTRTLRL